VHPEEAALVRGAASVQCVAVRSGTARFCSRESSWSSKCRKPCWMPTSPSPDARRSTPFETKAAVSKPASRSTSASVFTLAGISFRFERAAAPISSGCRPASSAESEGSVSGAADQACSKTMLSRANSSMRGLVGRACP